MNYYTDKKVVITGGSSGIGRAAALLCARAGASVGLIARDAAKLDGTVKEMERLAVSEHQKFLSVACSVGDRAALNEAARSLVSNLGGIDVLINSAGISYPSYIDKTPDDVWDSMMQIDYMGTVNSVRAFLPAFMEMQRGTIVNVSSVVGYMGVFGYAAYGAAKFAVVGFSECLRQDLLPYNIKVSVIYPPDTDTPQWHEENKIKPPETRALSGNIKVLSAESVAAALLAGAAKGSFAIVPGFMNKVTWFLSRHLPWLVWMIVSGDLRKFWKKHSRQRT
jgi:3-dehydrosphinganine reductase